MIDVAATASGVENVTYTGIDLFESRTSSDGQGVSLKLAHRILLATGARIRLLPGDPFTALLQRAANGLTGTDLVVISADQNAAALANAWFYVPRMLHATSVVFVERVEPAAGTTVLEAVARSQIDVLAGVGVRRRGVSGRWHSPSNDHQSGARVGQSAPGMIQQGNCPAGHVVVVVGKRFVGSVAWVPLVATLRRRRLQSRQVL